MSGNKDDMKMMHYGTEINFGSSNAGVNDFGMRPMQARVYENKDKQYLLVKAPPASGKSRALMYVALDKMRHQGLKKTIIAVPETAIGASFKTTDLTSGGFECDWEILDKNNLCITGEDASKAKVQAFKNFMVSQDHVLLCTHATFRNACREILAEQGVQAFDHCFLGIDEFHHVSAEEDNKLGEILRAFMSYDHMHIMAMTGSYFRGDAVPVLLPEDEDKFTVVTYSYYDQLQSYTWLKSLGIDCEFYRGSYLTGLRTVLDLDKKVIIHIPHRGSSEAQADKLDEVGTIYDMIGTKVGVEPKTKFDLLKTASGKILKVVNLVEENEEREIKKQALGETIYDADGKRDDEADKNRVDIIIALGMAKEGFDWIWCEQAITCGYRGSFTEIVQIIGRTTRDAPGKRRAVFTNLVADTGAESDNMLEVVNDYLKAIAGSLLMEQVLAPNFKFYRKEDGDGRASIQEDALGNVQIGIKDLKPLTSQKAKEIVQEDMGSLVETYCQRAKPQFVKKGVAPEELNQGVMTDILEQKYGDDLDEENREGVRQRMSAQVNITTLARQQAKKEQEKQIKQWKKDIGVNKKDNDRPKIPPMMEQVKKLVNVRELDMDLIDATNPFADRFEILSKDMDAQTFKDVRDAFIHLRCPMTEDEARANFPRIQRFVKEHHGRMPDPNASDDAEKRMGEALAWLQREKALRLRDKERG